LERVRLKDYKQPVPLPPEDGLNNIKVLEALVRSSTSNAVELNKDL
jgi:hypothetical protein